ncbi:MAG: DUF3999 family protein, partial [Lentisphaerota bacterium]
MIKVSQICFLALLLTSRAALVGAEDLRSKFEWRAELAGSMPSGTLGRVQVPDAVFEGCRRFPADLRIIDENGNQWPFFIWLPEKKSEIQILPSKKTNLSSIDSPDRYLRQDLELSPAKDGTRAFHSEIIASTSGSDFIRRVEVLGSDDGETWARMGEGIIISYARDFRVDNRTVSYPESNFRYLQIRIHPDARNPQESFRILHLDAASTRDQAARLEELPLQESEQQTVDQKTGKQTLVYDLSTANRPVEQLTIRVKNPEYARSLRTYGRNTLDGIWRWTADGEIHRFGKTVQESISLNGFSYRYIKLEL